MFDWLRKRDDLKLKHHLNGVKKVKVSGMRFLIKRVNPLLDLPSDKIPQLFTDSHYTVSSAKDPLQQKRMLQLMYAYLEAGVVDPKIYPVGIGEKKGKEPGLTPEDLFRDPTIGTKLYLEIVDYSMNTFRGLKGLFFSIKRRLLSFIILRVSMGSVRAILSSPITP